MQPYCIRVFANTRQFASCHPGPLFCANCRIRPLEVACQITFFCKSLYQITLSKSLRWIVSLQVAMLDNSFCKFLLPVTFLQIVIGSPFLSWVPTDLLHIQIIKCNVLRRIDNRTQYTVYHTCIAVVFVLDMGWDSKRGQ